MIHMDFQQLALAIKKRREYLGLTQLDLSELSEVALRTVNGLESGKASVNLNNLSAIADTLGLEIQLNVKKMAHDLV
jgi:y4mF family transcriptional regulator